MTEPEEDFLPHDSGDVTLNNLWKFSNNQWQFLFPREKVESETDTGAGGFVMIPGGSRRPTSLLQLIRVIQLIMYAVSQVIHGPIVEKIPPACAHLTDIFQQMSWNIVEDLLENL
jgi:hypothetical protein